MRASAYSLAASATAIYNSKEDKQEMAMLGEVGGIDDNTSNKNKNTDSSNKDEKMEEDMFFGMPRTS
jgi:hypothetical protein